MQIFAGKNFENPIDIIEAFDNESFHEAFKRIEILRKTHYLLGYIRYEAKDVFWGRKIKTNLPLLYFEVFSEEKGKSKEGRDGDSCHCEERQSHDAAIQSIKSMLDFSDYSNAIDKIKEEIAEGNTYEVNYTYDWQIESDLDGFELFNSILPRQKTPYNAYIKNDYEEILSFSPELFFEMKNNKIKTKPMKGTVKRGKDEQEDAQNIEFLRNDAKNRAENVMIVDLLRNDLGRIAKTGSVKVDKLFEVETHSTLHQMTSEISAELDENTTLFEIFDAIFPCGSITGAPKISTMEIIDKVEVGKRGVYCGAIGLISPKKTVFSVPIRILQKQKTKSKNTKSSQILCRCEEGQSPDAAIQEEVFGLPRRCTPRNDGKKYTCRVGGAIVWDSTAKEEWEETLTKISFLTNFNGVVGWDSNPTDNIHSINDKVGWVGKPNSIKLVETMLVKNGEIHDEDLHLKRMKNSAKELGFEFNLQGEKNKAVGLASLTYCTTNSRVGWACQPNNNKTDDAILRVLLDKNGNFETQIFPLDEIKTNKVSISKITVQSCEQWLYHKTTYRPWYDESMKKIKSGEIFDEIFFNEKGELTEGARSNIILQINGEFFTPPVESGLLNGVLRQKLLDNLHPHPEFLKFVPHFEIHPSPLNGEGELLGKIQEKVLYLKDLKKAEKVFCINSVRGIINVQVDFNITSPFRGEVDFQYEQNANIRKSGEGVEHDFNR